MEGALVGNGVSAYTDNFYRESKVQVPTAVLVSPCFSSPDLRCPHSPFSVSQVIASRGADIIAVANPALSMSSAILAESKSPKGTPKGSPKGSPGLASPNHLLKLEPQSPPQSPEAVQ